MRAYTSEFPRNQSLYIDAGLPAEASNYTEEDDSDSYPTMISDYALALQEAEGVSVIHIEPPIAGARIMEVVADGAEEFIRYEGVGENPPTMVGVNSDYPYKNSIIVVPRELQGGPGDVQNLLFACEPMRPDSEYGEVVVASLVWPGEHYAVGVNPDYRGTPQRELASKIADTLNLLPPDELPPSVPPAA